MESELDMKNRINMSIFWKYLAPVALTLACSPCLQAVTVEGYFSEWYYTGPGKPLAIDYHYNSIIFDENDNIVTNKQVKCNATYRCKLEIRRYDGLFFQVIESKTISGGATYSVDEFNKKVAAILPLNGIGKITADPKDSICVVSKVSTGWKEQEISNSCTGLGPPSPPVPSVPVTCDIEGLDNSIVDFGRLNTNEDARHTITASLRCTGDEGVSGSAKLRLEGMDPTQKNYAILNNVSGTAKIKVRMTIGNSNSNAETVTVKAGWAESRDLHFDITSSELAGKTGEFTGNAILSFTVQ